MNLRSIDITCSPSYPSPQTKNPLQKMSRDRGFALVVTLSLMILLTIIAVGLLTLSSISLRSSSQGEAMQIARANARLALMLAIGQMQQMTGPDQRVTVLADQRPKSGDGKETAAADAVELVGTGTLGTAATTGKVSVPALKFQQPNGKSAKLAWWVGDQGMKAAIATPIPGNDTALGAIRTRLQSAPRNAVEFAAAGAVKPFEKINPTDRRLGLVAS